MKYVFLILIVSLPFIMSCDPEPSSDVNQDRINTNYNATYNNNSDKLEAYASFWFGSTPLKLQSPAQVTANDASMKKTEILGIVGYAKTFSGYESSITFDYIDHDGNSYTNVVSIPSEIQLPSTITTFSASADLLITWLGAAIGEDESLNLEIWQGDDYHSIGQDNAGGKSILLGAGTLGSGFVGDAKMQLSRTKKSDLQEGPRKGDLTGTYSSRKIEVVITE